MRKIYLTILVGMICLTLVTAGLPLVLRNIDRDKELIVFEEDSNSGITRTMKEDKLKSLTDDNKLDIEIKVKVDENDANKCAWSGSKEGIMYENTLNEFDCTGMTPQEKEDFATEQLNIMLSIYSSALLEQEENNYADVSEGRIKLNEN